MDDRDTAARPLPSIPQLPVRMLQSPPVILVGTSAWLIVLICAVIFEASQLIRYALAGVGIGLFGLFVFCLQLTASRKGKRTAQNDVQ